MDDSERGSKKFIPPNASENTKNIRANEKISGLTVNTRSVNVLHLITGFSQMFLGISVITVSILGLIQPFWLSTVLSIFASIATIVGIYFCYSAIYSFNTDTLLRDAMRRIVEDQN